MPKTSPATAARLLKAETLRNLVEDVGYYAWRANRSDARLACGQLAVLENLAANLGFSTSTGVLRDAKRRLLEASKRNSEAKPGKVIAEVRTDLETVIKVLNHTIRKYRTQG